MFKLFASLVVNIRHFSTSVQQSAICDVKRLLLK